MTLNDRFTKGLIAGMLAGFPSLVWGLLSRHVLHFTTLLYSDFAAILTYGNRAQGLWAKLFAQLVVFGFWGFGGIVFAYLIRSIDHKNLILKGVCWGAGIWFLSYVTTLLFKVPGLLHIPLATAVSQLFGGVIWGGSLALVLGYLDRLAGKQRASPTD